MTGFVLIFHRDGKHVPGRLASEMLARIEHRGPDGVTEMLNGNLFLGCRHYWTTPEEVGEFQPLVSEGGRYWLAFDGRLDNRATLIEALGLMRRDREVISDAALLLVAFQRWHQDTWRRLLGPFVCAIYDHVDHRVICARDALGGRSLCYYLDRSVLLIASEPSALFVHPSVSNRLNQDSVARLFTWSFPVGETLFRDVCQLAPGSILCIGEVQSESSRFWSMAELAETTPVSLRADDEYAEEYRRLMQEAIRCRLRVNGRAAMKLSGGLDSSAVAALWSAEGNDTGTCVPAYSWVFNEFPACDEREYISELGRHCGLMTNYVNCDSVWTLCNVAKMSENPNQPDLELFRGVQELLHRHMASDGVRAVLTGYYGDDLYQGDDRWFASLVADQHWRIAWKILSEGSPGQGLRSLRSSIRMGPNGVLPFWPTRRWNGPRQSSAFPEWLTPAACEILAATDHRPPDQSRTARDERHVRLFNPRLSWFSNLAAYANVRHDLEERHPFRDLRLVEFMLSIPTHQLRRGKTSRFVLRNAMDKYWPDKIKRRTGKTALAQIAAFGLCIRERPTFLRLLRVGRPFWSQYVKPTWVNGAIESENHRQGCGPELWVPWVCIALTHWLYTHYPDNLESRIVNKSDRASSG